MPLIGWGAGRYFADYIKAFDHWIAFILLSFIGGKMIFEALKKKMMKKKLRLQYQWKLAKIKKENLLI